MVGIRLDSGDLAYLSIEARKILDDAGFPKASILASNDLDEHIIASLKQQGAKIAVWGVGTKLATAYDQPALGGVYKLRRPSRRRSGRVAIQAQAVGATGEDFDPRHAAGPPVQQGGDAYVADAIFNELQPPAGRVTLVDPDDMTRRKTLGPDLTTEDLLVPVFRGGRRVYDPPPLAHVRQRTAEQLSRFHPGVKRFTNPHAYPVGLERSLFDLRTKLILDARGVQA